MICDPLAAVAQRANVLTSEQIIQRLTTRPAQAQTRSLRRPAETWSVSGRDCGTATPDNGDAPGSRSVAVSARNLSRVDAPAVELDVPFELGSSTLRPEGRRQLEQLAAAISAPQLADSSFIVAGHTDARGTPALNDALSCQRALAVRDYLSRSRGIRAERLHPMGFGFSKLKIVANPLADANRRVEIRKIAP
jgi:outer membrane protein OmpA-like peptidoglycan-associated protein